MIRKIKNAVWQILNFTPIGPLLQLYLVGEIKNNGWLKSFVKKKAVDKNGDYIPWFTYPSVDFLKEKLKNNLTVFEYGCGGSTKWFAERVNQITAVEDHKDWMEFVKKDKLDNMHLIFQSVDEKLSYSKSIKTTNQLFDIIIVDGKERVNCIEQCIANLSESGIIILDDSFREEYKEGINFLVENGFKYLNFWGMVPVVANKSCTSIFYRDNNVFDI